MQIFGVESTKYIKQ